MKWRIRKAPQLDLGTIKTPTETSKNIYLFLSKQKKNKKKRTPSNKLKF